MHEDSEMTGPLPEVTWRSIVRAPNRTKAINDARMHDALMETMPYMLADETWRTGAEVVPDPTAFDRLSWSLTIDRWLRWSAAEARR